MIQNVQHEALLVVILSELIFPDYFELCNHIVHEVPQPPAQKLSGRPWSFIAIGIGPGLGETDADGDEAPGTG